MNPLPVANPVAQAIERRAEFLTEIEALDTSEGWQTRAFRLVSGFTFYSEVLRDAVTVPKGFEFDGESIPTWLHWLVPPFGQSRRGACAHDYLYRHAGYYRPEGTFVLVSRATADAVYRELTALKGLPKWRGTMRYWVLRAVGGVAWRENRRRENPA